MITFSRLGRYGQIGNQMFQIAGTIGVATKQNDNYAFPAWFNHDGVAKGNMDESESFMERHFDSILPRIDAYSANRCQRVEVPWGYNPRFRCTNNADLIGHFQSEKWFKHCESIIRSTFKFRIKVKSYKGVAVHVRGGDYDGLYHNRLTQKYYHEAMQIMYERGHRDFTVFSDDPDFALSVTGMNSIDVKDPIESMCMMSGYDSNIIANSSFSWWAAWLSGNIDIIAPSQWVGKAAMLDTSDIIPDDWLKIDV